MRPSLIWTIGFPLLLLACAVVIADDRPESFSPYVNGTGDILLPDPKVVRAHWSHLGSWVIRGDDSVEQFHTVYTQPDTISVYRRSGEFPDGAVLVKEVRKATGSPLTTGNVSWNGAEVLWFVMIKDRKNRFPDNPIWANAWGWALFLAEDPAKNVATDFRADCMTCHEPAQKNEWVYTQGYPVLSD